MPRPKERIPEVLDGLKKVWEKYPDQRLGQLLVNIHYKAWNGMPFPLYETEEEMWLKGINEILNGGM